MFPPAKPNPCDSSPCLNGGLCAMKNQSYACYCPSLPQGTFLFSGRRCEYKFDLSKGKSKCLMWSFKDQWWIQLF